MSGINISSRTYPAKHSVHSREALTLILLLALLLCAAGSTVLRTSTASSAPPGPPGMEGLMDAAQEKGSVRVIVGLDVGFQPEGELARTRAVSTQRQLIRTAQNAVLAEMAGTTATMIARFEYIPYIAFRVDPAALAQLAALPQTTSFEEDIASPPALASSIPIIGADDAWAAGYTGSGQTVAILDTGVQKTHPYFSTGGNRVVAEACYSSNYAPHNATSVCPGGVEESTVTGSGVDCTAAAAGLPDAIDGCRHGTHVAGITAGDNGGANIGVARDANIIAVQIFSLFLGGACGPDPSCVLTYDTDQIKGLERVYALRNTYDIAAVNMSIGGGPKQTTPCNGDPLKAIIDNLRSADIATVISAGNDGFNDGLSTPACISTAVSVGATEDDDDVAVFSNVATFLDLLAPGVSIDASVPGGGEANFQGTSMAAPHVTGAWAVAKQRSPSASVDDVLAAFQNTGTSVNDGRPGGSVIAMRRINLNLALAQLNAGLTIAKSVVLPRNPVWRGDPITYTIRVTNNSGTAVTGVHITDTLPMYVNGIDLDATTTVPAGDSVTYQIDATLASDAPYGNTITNTAFYNHASDQGQSSAGFKVSGETHYGYLPLLLNNHYVWDAYFEPNNRLSDAYGPLTSGIPYLAHPDDVDDYYFFVLSAPSLVTVTVGNFTPTSNNGTVALYGPVLGNERGELVDYHGPRGDTAMALGPHNLGAGKYYIQVYTTGNTSTTELYSLAVTY